MRSESHQVRSKFPKSQQSLIEDSRNLKAGGLTEYRLDARISKCRQLIKDYRAKMKSGKSRVGGSSKSGVLEFRIQSLEKSLARYEKAMESLSKQSLSRSSSLRGKSETKKPRVRYPSIMANSARDNSRRGDRRDRSLNLNNESNRERNSPDDSSLLN